MTDTELEPEHIDRITRSAAVTASILPLAPSVQVSIAPGDHTIYHLLIARSLPWVHTDGGDLPFAAEDEFIVCLLNLDGRSYPWSPTNSAYTSPGYVLSHWTDHRWTAEVVATFLNALRTILHPQEATDAQN